MNKVISSPALATVACLAAGAAAAQPACDLAPNQGDPVVLAEIQVWHGLPSHTAAFDTGCIGLPPRPYDSRDPDVISAQIQAAKDQGIDGFVVDWYGPGPVGWWNDEDREFMDLATSRLFAAAAERGDFCVALMYDEGTLRCGASGPCPGAMDRAAADLAYADAAYLFSPAYLKLAGKPAVFVFPYPDIDPCLDWAALRTAMSGHEVNLIDQDPGPCPPMPPPPCPCNPARDALFDGFFAWVNPGAADWDPYGLEWGRDYLHWFYQTMASPDYAGKLAVGGVWPGFDDLLAPWAPPGENRFMSRAGGEVWDGTWELAGDYAAGVVMIATWNDYEEGTDVESGVQMVVDMQEAEANTPQVLVRSSPLDVTWDGGLGTVQVYYMCSEPPVYNQGDQSPPVTLGRDPPLFEPEEAYEIKLWLSPEPISRIVKIRSRDPHPDYIFHDGFETGDLGAWSPSVEGVFIDQN
jgi:hypothetical protein